jgi:hypothetical protein
VTDEFEGKLKEAAMAYYGIVPEFTWRILERECIISG